MTTKDPAKKLWIGNIPEEASWKDLQALVDKAKWLCFRWSQVTSMHTYTQTQFHYVSLLHLLSHLEGVMKGCEP